MIAQITKSARGSGRSPTERDRAQAELEAHLDRLADQIAPELTTQQVYEKYCLIDDQFLPSAHELEIVFDRYNGKVLRHIHNPALFAVEMPGKSIVGSKARIWNWYTTHREALEAMLLDSLPF